MKLLFEEVASCSLSTHRLSSNNLLKPPTAKFSNTHTLVPAQTLSSIFAILIPLELVPISLNFEGQAARMRKPS